MKKSTFVFLPFSILANAMFLSLGMECLFNLLGFAMAISLDGSSVTAQYPRFIPFCFFVGIIALLGLIATYIINLKLSEKLGLARIIWFAQYILAFILSFLVIRIWIRLFEFLQNTF